MSKKLIVITGASSGIGKATAEIFSQAGYPLLLLGRRLELMKEMNLPNALCAKVDVTDMDSFKKAICDAEKSMVLLIVSLIMRDFCWQAMLQPRILLSGNACLMLMLWDF